MECTVERVTPFPQSQFEDRDQQGPYNAVAAVTLALGPVALRVRLLKRDDTQRMWLQMPGKKGKDDKWFDYIQFRDLNLVKQLEARAVELYNSQN